MRPTTTTILMIASICVTPAHGLGQDVDNCSELLRQSRTTSQTIMSRNSFESNVEQFCDESNRARSENRRLNFDLGDLGVGSGGASSADADTLHTKYCREDASQSAEESGFQQYLEGIEPGAYAAYAACTTASADGVQFQMLTPVTRDILELVVFHETNTRGVVADMSWSASSPVRCRWDDTSGGEESPSEESPPVRPLEPNERTRLRCVRDSFNADPITESDFVNVIRDGGDAAINIPWPKYDSENEPIPRVSELEREINELRGLKQEIDELRGELQTLTQQKVRVQSGEVRLPSNLEIRPIARRNGGREDRGIVNGRVVFPMPFSSVPTVLLTIGTLDVWVGANTRVSATVTSVDLEGFNYDLYSWSDTRLYGVSASWIAVAVPE